jgi:hypothetical protein
MRSVVQTAYRGWVVRKHGSFRICKAITDLYVEREQEASFYTLIRQCLTVSSYRRLPRPHGYRITPPSV